MNISSGKSAAPGKQQGMAALLVILLTGLSLSALTVGVMNYVSTAQDSGVSVHARTQAEINAWAGVEAWRLYLEGKDAAALPAGAQIKDAGGNTIATVEKVAGCRSSEFCYKMVGRSADSTALLEVAFGSGSLPAPPPRLESAMTLNTNLKFSGDNFIVKNQPGMGGLIVDGDIDINGISSAYSTPTCAKGNIYFGGGSNFGGSFAATGDIWVKSVSAKGASLDATNIWIDDWNSEFAELRYRGFLATVDTRISKVTGIGNFYVPGAWSNITIAESSRIGGKAVVRSGSYCTGDGKGFTCSDPRVSSPTRPLSNLFTDDSGLQQPAALPAVTCNTRLVKLDLDALESQANYIFYFDQSNGHPMLKIQNMVNRASRRSLDGVYDLSNETATVFPKDISLPLMRCNGQACDFRRKTKGSGWGSLDGLTMPPGVIYFKKVIGGNSDVSISTPANNTLHNSIMLAGKLLLKDAGSNFALKAPNFSVVREQNGKKQADACSQAAEPTQLCDGQGNLIAWQSSVGTHHGLPIANAAVMAEGDFEARGWKIYGNLIVGKRVVVSGAKVTLLGTIWSGDVQALQDDIKTDIGATGLEVDATGLTPDQLAFDSGVSNGGSGGGAGGGNGLISSPIVIRARPL